MATKELSPELLNCIKNEFAEYKVPTWDVLFMRLVYEVASKSKDPKTKIAAYIVGPNHEPISFGFNGIPRNVNDVLKDRSERPRKYLFYEHGERNAIFSVARVGGPTLIGTTMYTQSMPCADCGRAVIQSGISTIVTHSPYEKIFSYLYDTWTESCNTTVEMFQEAGIKCRTVDDLIGVTAYINGKVIEI